MPTQISLWVPCAEIINTLFLTVQSGRFIYTISKSKAIYFVYIFMLAAMRLGVHFFDFVTDLYIDY